jgi:hypothetical protein
MVKYSLHIKKKKKKKKILALVVLYRIEFLQILGYTNFEKN